MPATDSIKRKLTEVPHKPGVYLMKDRFGTVIYVGKARDLKKRVATYFQPGRRLGWDLKFNALVEAIHDFDVHAVKSEPEAMLLEGKLIKEFHPRYNVSFRDDKRFLLLKVNLQDPIPRFTLTRFRTDDGSRYFGPFPNAGALRNTLTLIRRQFNLRGCRPLTPTEADYKHCLYGNLKHCTAPCIGNVTHEQYLEQVRAAAEFLEGQCGEMVEQLEVEMKKAALGLEFEKAADLRDLIADLKRTTRKTTRFQRTPWNLPVSIMPERDNVELGEALGLPSAPGRIEGFDISNISGTFKVASVVSFKLGRPDRANYRRLKIKSVEGQDDFACMAEAVRRRYTRLLRESRGEPADPEEEADRPIVEELRALMQRAGENSLHDEHVLGVDEPHPVPAPAPSPTAELMTVPSPSPRPSPPVIRGKALSSSARSAPGPDQDLIVSADSPRAIPAFPGGEGRSEGEGGRNPPAALTTLPDGPPKSPIGREATNLPDLIVIDGGKGQLSMAVQELEKLGLGRIPVIGLAKEFEEIYRPGRSEPLRLSHDNNALKLLQRIRDESHRVANSYNAQLRLRKISESLLDEFPGIGDKRKQALLRKFGSLQRLRTASLEEIASVPGFGGKAAAELKTFLEARS